LKFVLHQCAEREDTKVLSTILKKLFDIHYYLGGERESSQVKKEDEDAVAVLSSRVEMVKS